MNARAHTAILLLRCVLNFSLGEFDTYSNLRIACVGFGTGEMHEKKTMKRYQILISLFLFAISMMVQTTFAQAQAGDVKTNPKAPANYDANLRPNDLAVAVNSMGNLAAVKIISKSDGRYQVVTVEHPNHIYWYSANSVYPYFDDGEFDRIKFGNSKYLAAYLECYAKKNNMDVDRIKGGVLIPRYGNAREMKADLLSEQANLAEIETQLKAKLQNQPNTFSEINSNPGLWYEIVTNRDQYLQCALGEKTANAATESAWLKARLEIISKLQTEVDGYDSSRGYLVKGDGIYLLYAVSRRERAEWLKESQAEEFQPNLDPVLDALARSAVKKLPMYKPEMSYFKFRDAAAEKLLMNNLKSPATVKVYRIGVSSGWDIQKDNYGLLPSYRYKYANVYYRDSSDDHPFCRVMSARIKQDYAGGGRYNPQMYRSSTDFSLAGCPAGP